MGIVGGRAGFLHGKLRPTPRRGAAASSQREVAGPERRHYDPAVMRDHPVPWRFSPHSIAVRLFLTCWVVYVLHFATNIVREIYPALALGDHFSFRVDEYAHMHPDLYEKPGYGWHIGNNPGASMLAAIPYALARPIIDPLVARAQASRQASGLTEPPGYESPWPMAREFYAEAWRRGLDIKFGLGSFVMQAFCMAPSTALAVVALFFLLRRIFGSDRTALWLSLLYAFGTPAFFRTGFLNHNLMLGHITFFGFLTLWNPAGSGRSSLRGRYVLGGLAGGTALLFDYSGVVLLLALFAYGLLRRRLDGAALPDVARHGLWYVVGTLAPVLLLWFYQWKSFGHPFYPGQHWMPPVEWIELGYQGYGGPQLELLWMLAFDGRFGIFVTCPLFLLALAAPLLDRGSGRVLPRVELWVVLGFFVVLWVFFSGSNYTRLQFNTGIRYLAPAFAFLFVPAAAALMRLPGAVIYGVAVLSVAHAWALAMFRDVERGRGLLDPLLHVFLGGFQLPALTRLSQMESYQSFFAMGVSPLPLFALAGALIYGVWTIGTRRQS
jgi:hypothetical protein